MHDKVSKIIIISASFAVLIIASLGLIAYIPGLQILGSISPEFIPMALSTGISFLFISIILILNIFNFWRKGFRLFAVILTSFIGIFGLLKWIEYVTGINITFEKAIINNPGVVSGFPVGVMSSYTGGLFFISGIIIVLLIFHKARKIQGDILGNISGILGTFIFIYSLIFIIGYLFQQPFLYDSERTVPMAVTSAVAFLFLAIALIFATGIGFFPLKFFAGSSIRSMLLRTFIPFVVCLILIQSIVTEYFHHTYLINNALITAGMLMFFLIIVGFIVFRLVYKMGNQLDTSEKKLKYMSFHDSLTGLFNKAFFEEELARLDTKRQLQLSIIMGDLNHLKLTNDAFGHKEGDSIIIGAAEIIKRICRSDDIIARWGGDEFVVLLPKTSKVDCENIICRIREECKKTKNYKIPLSLSLGAATKEQAYQNINIIFRDAENNMYKNKLAEKESVSSFIIFSLEKELYEKNIETEKHIDRIRNNSIKLGQSIKLPLDQLTELSQLASLHDIGKVAIPEKILMKKDKLSEKEWEIIKRHPEIGHNIAQTSPQISHLAKSILNCHEHWDGSGYPQGSKGENIPITSRIILIVEAYDEMTIGRHYKDPVSPEKAIEKLIDCAGIIFDPVIVNKFIKIISEDMQ